MENSTELPQKLKIGQLYDAANPLPGICPKEIKTGCQRDICTPMFTTSKTWKQPKCLSIYWSIIQPFGTTWMDLEGIMLSEIS